MLIATGSALVPAAMMTMIVTDETSVTSDRANGLRAETDAIVVAIISATSKCFEIPKRLALYFFLSVSVET